MLQHPRKVDLTRSPTPATRHERAKFLISAAGLLGRVPLIAYPPIPDSRCAGRDKPSSRKNLNSHLIVLECGNPSFLESRAVAGGNSLTARASPRREPLPLPATRSSETLARLWKPRPVCHRCQAARRIAGSQVPFSFFSAALARSPFLSADNDPFALGPAASATTSSVCCSTPVRNTLPLSAASIPPCRA
jgi:hypothetical protein